MEDFLLIYCMFVTVMVNMEQTSFAAYYFQSTNLNDVDSDV